MDNSGQDLDVLFCKFRAGDRSSLVSLFGELKRPLFSFLFRMSQNPEISEDLLQETFISIFSRSETFDPTRKFVPWAFGIARNKFLEWKRRETKIVRMHQKRVTPTFQEKSAVEMEQRVDIGSAIGLLGEPLREAFILKHFHGRKFREIAEIQGIPLPTAKSRVLSAARKIRVHLEIKHEK